MQHLQNAALLSALGLSEDSPMSIPSISQQKGLEFTAGSNGKHYLHQTISSASSGKYTPHSRGPSSVSSSSSGERAGSVSPTNGSLGGLHGFGCAESISEAMKGSGSSGKLLPDINQLLEHESTDSSERNAKPGTVPGATGASGDAEKAFVRRLQNRLAQQRLRERRRTERRELELLAATQDQHRLKTAGMLDLIKNLSAEVKQVQGNNQ